jgi:hypothetical protein
VRTLPRPPVADSADDGLSAFVNVNVLDRDLLCALAAVAIEGLQQRCVCPRQLVRLAEVFSSSFKRLLANHGAPVTFHGGAVTGDDARRSFETYSLVAHACDLLRLLRAEIGPTRTRGARRNESGY